MVYRIAKGRAGIWFAVMAAAFGCTGKTGWAQSTTSGSGQLAATAPGQSATARSVHFTKRRTFHLPVKFDPRSRMRIREVRLYKKTASTNWVRHETGTSATSKFTYSAAQDGAYWFCVTTVDDQGRTLPPSIEKSLKIVVDSTPPRIEVQPWMSPEGQQCIRCTVMDANPHPETLVVSFVDRANNMQPMQRHLQHAGVYVAPNRSVWTGKLHVRCLDKAKNETSMFTAVELPPIEIVAQKPAPLPAHLPKKITQQPVQPQDAVIPLPPLPKETPVIPAVSKKIVEQPSLPPKIEAPNAIPNPTPPVQHTANLINTTKAEVEYRIDKVGPSGVGVVDIYMSKDNGRNWTFLQKDTDMRTPAQIQLPGDGDFGIRVVITNGNGFGGTPPRPGDQPDFHIEVDTTRPQARLADVDPYAKGGKLEIRWTATDQNLRSAPVALYYRTSSTKSWQPIAKNVRNEGTYSWAFPRDEGGRFYVKMEVTDLAGNVTRVETANPVVLDMTEPRAQIVGVRPVSREPAPFQVPPAPQQ